ncbi:PAS domain-containing protein [Peribacillus saganii]|uniref:PAS domain-containing protein n=2 Tax=Peribacillus saganii TaxID=2303992 RepID=A0A372LQL3_9BACI|nr:PAS domain-containing protein [Peribacillus saganii]
MARILVIAPYPGLRDLFEEVNNDLKKDIHIEVGDLYRGLSIAKEMEQEGFDIIISRGATARLIRKHCNIPVIEVKISGYDILRTLTLVKGYPGKMGLMSYFNTIQGADAIGTLLEMDLSFYSIDREEEIKQGIRKAVEDEVQVIIGDVITTSVASGFGLNAILITSGRESVIESIEEAEQVAFYTQKERKGRRFFETVSRSFHEGVIAVNAQEEVQLINEKAEKFLGIKEEQIIGQQAAKIHQLLQFDVLFSRKQASFETICKLHGEDFVLRKFILEENGEIVGGLAFLEEIGEVQRMESRIRQKFFAKPMQARMHFNQLVAINETLKEQFELGSKFSRNDSPVLIYGEPGSGKQSLGQAIHNESVRKDFPFVFINCEAYTAEQLEAELFGTTGGDEKAGAFEAAHNGTLFIDAVGKMPLSVQAKLINVLQESKITHVQGDQSIPVNVRLISAHSCDLKEEITAGGFREDLFHMINGATLTIPALRERKEDIPELVRWFIASFNAKYGKQIVGLRPDVMERLKAADWPGNVQQLKNMIERICISTSTGPFIELAEIMDILNDLFEEQTPIGLKGNVIDIENKTLEELEKEIIARVLEEEDYNQSHAAKRLGINRSTLWRKIREDNVTG